MPEMVNHGKERGFFKSLYAQNFCVIQAILKQFAMDFITYYFILLPPSAL